MDVVLFNKVCLYDTYKNETIVYGQYKKQFNRINIDRNISSTVVFCDSRPDFYIKMSGKISTIKTLSFFVADREIKLSNVTLCFPFKGCDLLLNNTSAIISTICKNYSHRLDEWIQYNLQLGFAGIIIFNNDDNNANSINESTENCVLQYSTADICKKYKGKVWMVDFPYSPFDGEHWNTIQRITLHLGVNALRKKCRHIALIDADEFIYLPKTPSVKIETFLKDYSSIAMRSNILTNKHENDILNNNILQLAEYVGEDKYTKAIVHTATLTDNEFIITPHTHPSARMMDKEDIIHYHCWMNTRYAYNDSMAKIDFLKRDRPVPKR